MFQHDIKQANKLMRSAIPLMVKLDIPPTPYNYGIWYQYASNKNPKLNQVVDRALRRFGSLPSFVSQELFNEFLIPDEFHYAHRQQPALNKLTNNLEHGSHAMSDALLKFHCSLESAKDAINEANSEKDIENLTKNLERSTAAANHAVSTFNLALQSAQQELATLKKELMDVKKNSELDPLTLLANEKGFERTLFARTPYAEDDLSLLLIDIDNLGSINEEYGYKAGTSLIRYLSKLFLNLLPENGFIARLEGGRFAILLSETELSLASKLAESIRAAVSQQKIRYKNTKVLLRQVTVSIGVSTLFGHENPVELIQRSKHNLLFAKRSGKNQIAHHE